jgi:hypothetical protein
MWTTHSPCCSLPLRSSRSGWGQPASSSPARAVPRRVSYLSPARQQLVPIVVPKGGDQPMSARRRPAVAKLQPAARRRVGLAGGRRRDQLERGWVPSTPAFRIGDRSSSSWFRRVGGSRDGGDRGQERLPAAERTLEAAPRMRRGRSRRRMVPPAALTPAFAGPYHRCFGAISALDLCLPSTLTGLRESFP